MWGRDLKPPHKSGEDTPLPLGHNARCRILTQYLNIRDTSNLSHDFFSI
ncbi:hypothetical protein SLEP1_g14873 [Rubroshorea leprosula]|uniref:Uncharacterized protein n=1 Tax=Rubroshorea leprosula TaxID=152421 RepID=A0AAV5IKK9_9ROSI|nr:hypothetical protein SLEP1_g14873 [Rubroshorea leprosula]